MHGRSICVVFFSLWLLFSRWRFPPLPLWTPANSNCPENITIVDAGGNLKAFYRMDGAFLGSVDVSMKKARTARMFNMSTAQLGAASQPGQELFGIEVTNGGLVIFGGGELLKDKNYEILYLTGETDEFVLQMLGKYADKEFRSIVDGELDLGGEEQKDIDEKPELMQFVKETLGDKIKEARASRRLKTHPVCMTAGEGFSFEMEKYFKNFQMPTPVKADRILELNTDHPAVQAMEAAMTSDRTKAELYAKILYDQALLIAGLPLEDPSEYTDLVAELMK